MKRERGFSLIEVMLAMTIFMLLAGGIYAAVSVSIDATAAVTEARLKSERLDGLERFLREAFLALPGDSTVEIRAREGGLDLLLTPAPAWAAFSRGAGEQGLVLSGAKGTGIFSIANFTVSTSPQRVDAELSDASWIPLLPNLQNISWRFTNSANSGRLQETWEAGSGRPELANLEFNLTDGTQVSWFFQIPKVASAPKTEARP